MPVLTNNQKGNSLLLTVMMLTTLLTLLLAISEIVQRNLAITKISSRAQPAYLAAESGAERILWAVRKNNSGTITINGDDSVSFSPVLTFTNANTSIAATSVLIGAERTVTVTGIHFDAQRKIRLKYNEFQN